jgi:hypothetical protein
MEPSLRGFLLVLLLLPLAALADLTGRWQGDDGGVYYLRQKGEELYWYGEQKVTEPRWANVFRGRIRGERINGVWLDVPKGQTLGEGNLSLVIRNTGQVLERTHETGGFGPTRWTRVGALPEPAQAAPVMPLKPMPSQVVMPAPVLQEDCIAFNPANITVTQANNRWKIAEGSHWLFDFEGRQDEARQALRVLRHYGMNQTCYVGRPQPALTYMLANGAVPAGSLRGEDCVAFNTANLAVVQAGGRWKIADGGHWLFDFEDKRDEAEQALALLRKYGFTHSCYVGRPQPSFTYLRR